MAWIITKDHIADKNAAEGTNANAVGVCGPSRAKPETIEALKAGGGHAFRMLDDDGELYYEGRCTSCDDNAALGPLDNFGMPNAGATTIQYKVKGKWTNLN